MATQKKIEVVTSLMKTAAAGHETEITPAYVQGFCKVAEDFGIDPEELMKVAGFGDWLSDKWNRTKSLASSAWNGTKDIASSAWNVAKEIPGAFKEQIGDGTMLKNFGTGAARLGTGLMQGVSSVVRGAGGVVGALGSGFTGNGFGNGWNAGTNFMDNVGIGSYTLGAGRAKMDEWQNRLRDDYLARNNINPNNPASMNWADKLALLGSDTAEVAGKAIGETVAMNGAMGAVGKLGGGVARAYAGSTGLGGRAMNLAGRAVNRGANMMRMTGPMGGKGSALWTGITMNRALDAQGNYNRAYQDLAGSGITGGASQNHYDSIGPADISDKMQWNV